MPMTKTFCSRCWENAAQIDALCNECMWFILIGQTTFTESDIYAMFAMQEESHYLELARGI